MHQRGRRVRTIAACLVAGVIVNFALAMACALWSPVGLLGETFYEAPHKPRHAERLLAVLYSGVEWDQAIRPKHIFIVASGRGVQVSRIVPTFGTEYAMHSVELEELASGWPLTVLSTHLRTHHDVSSQPTSVTEWTDSVPSPEWLHAINLVSASSGSSLGDFTLATKRRPIPLGVEWRGAVFGSGFWAGVILLIVTTARILREHRRVMRARCPACAYPLGDGGVCPECGTPLRVRAVPATLSSFAPATSSVLPSPSSTQVVRSPDPPAGGE